MHFSLTRSNRPGQQVKLLSLIVLCPLQLGFLVERSRSQGEWDYGAGEIQAVSNTPGAISSGTVTTLDQLGISSPDELESNESETASHQPQFFDSPPGPKQSTEWRPASTPTWKGAYTGDRGDDTSGGAVLSRPEVSVSSDTGITWDDNIFLRETSPESDWIYHLSSLLRIRSGDFTHAYSSRGEVEYRPSLFIFTDHSSENSHDHDARASIQHAWNRLTTGADVSYQKTSGGNSDFGDRVDKQEFGAEVLAAYAIGDRTRAEFTAAYTNERYDTEFAFDSNDISGKLFADYQASASTHVAVGGSIGQLETDQSPAQDYQQGLVRMRSQLTPKWQLRAEGGVDRRESGNGDDTTPVFEIGLRGESDSAMLDLKASREIQPSGALGDQNYISTQLGLSGSQRVTDRFKLTLGGGIEWLDYTQRGAGVGASRNDTYYFLRPGIRYKFNRFHGDLYYEFLKNSSDSSGSSYDVNRIGASIGTEF
jgi:hypothetical protein